MSKIAVIKTGGKQYLVKENETLIVDKLAQKKDEEVEFNTLAVFDPEGEVELGMPVLESKVKAKILEFVKGDKVRVSRFKAKVRYRRVKGFRPQYTKIQILSIS